MRLDWRLDVPRAGLEGRARCGAAFASVAFVCSQMRGLHGVRRPARGQGEAGRLSGWGCTKALGLEMKALLGDGLGFALCGLLQRGRRTLPSRL
jgi:hypothetical protein